MSDSHWSATSDALAELARIVTEAQANNPLAPVTVMVPSHASGLDVTRYLGRTLNDGEGSAAVHAYTLHDLATELIAAHPAMRGRSPLPPTIRLGAISKALTEQPGIFAPVADQPATARAIARTAVVLDSVQPYPTTNHPETTQQAEALPQLTQEVLRLHRAAADALHTIWYTQHEAFTIAAEKLQEPAVQKRLGTVIGFMLGTELQPDALMFRNSLDAAGMKHITAAGTIDDATTVITASDADDETRAVARLVVEQLDAGTPGHRIGVFYSVAQPYNALLVQRLTEAGVTFVGPAPRTLTDSPFARGLLQFLALDTADPDKRTILNILAEGTLVWRDHELPGSATCERLHSNPPSDEENDDGPTHTGATPTRSTRDRENFALFNAFLTALTNQIKHVQAAQSWADVSTSLTTLINEFMGPRSAQELPERANARETLTQLSSDLSKLDGIGPLPRPALIRSTLEDAIASKGGWAGKVGAGVVVGSYADAVGRDLDVVYLMGAAEGRAPTRISEDPLLPDAIRASLNGNLPTVEQRAQAKKEQFFAALASGTKRTITSPRGDLRAAGNYELTRWISGAKTSAEKRELPSFAHSIEHGSPTANALAVTEQEWRIRHLLTASDRAAVITEDPVLNRSIALTRDRHDASSLASTATWAPTREPSWTRTGRSPPRASRTGSPAPSATSSNTSSRSRSSRTSSSKCRSTPCSAEIWCTRSSRTMFARSQTKASRRRRTACWNWPRARSLSSPTPSGSRTSGTALRPGSARTCARCSTPITRRLMRDGPISQRKPASVRRTLTPTRRWSSRSTTVPASTSAGK
ncbi:hypothetical protein JOE65_001055 [Arthrobacter roseus]|nr:hypothetical protein [Arthrobacter roseus]